MMKGWTMKMKKILKILGIILAAVLIIVGTYVAYVLISYHRLADNIALKVDNGTNAVMSLDKTYSITTYNIGFGAYSPDYSFFMDGGTESWAKSKESDIKNVTGAVDNVAALKPDIMLFQEVDLNATRSYHVNQYDIMKSKLPKLDSVDAIDYDSSFLFYPFTQPQGKSLSSIVTLSKINILDSTRRSLPIATSLSKLLDLDRCFSVTQIETETGKNLYVYNTHLSAYGSNTQLRTAQVKMLFGDMEEKIKQGDYVICGGDFNHDLLGNSAQLLNSKSVAQFGWAQPFPKELIPKDITLCSNYADKQLIPTTRNDDAAYVKGKTYVVIIDGFFISSNVECVKVQNIDTGFDYSDHNPVLLQFKLK